MKEEKLWKMQDWIQMIMTISRVYGRCVPLNYKTYDLERSFYYAFFCYSLSVIFNF